MTKIPEFFIVGAPKCGTTTLYNWLKEHPDLFLPQQKEPHYFAQNLSDRYCRIRDKESYLDLFSPASDGQKCGEASVLYCFFDKSIGSILKFNPKAKIIYMLRNPVNVVPSYHAQLQVNLEENQKNIEKSWDLQAERKAGQNLPKTSQDPYLLQYLKVCATGSHLQNIINLVPQKQRMVIFLDDLASDPEKIYHQVLEFLEVENHGRTDFLKANESAGIQFTFLQKILTSQSIFIKPIRKVARKILPRHFLLNFNRRKKDRDPLQSEFKKKLLKAFADDISLTEKLTKRNLSHWRNQ